MWLLILDSPCSNNFPKVAIFKPDRTGWSDWSDRWPVTSPVQFIPLNRPAFELSSNRQNWRTDRFNQFFPLNRPAFELSSNRQNWRTDRFNQFLTKPNGSNELFPWLPKWCLPFLLRSSRTFFPHPQLIVTRLSYIKIFKHSHFLLNHNNMSEHFQNKK